MALKRAIAVRLDKVKNAFVFLDKFDIFSLFVGVGMLCFGDLISKYIVFSYQSEGVYVLPFFNIIKARNFGISFGMFHESGNIAKMLILLFNVAVIIYLLTLFKNKKKYSRPMLFTSSLECIIGGALGNMIDRIYCGFVHDFIDLHIGGIHWPTFNVADICVCSGVGILIFCELFMRVDYDKKDAKK